MLFPTTLVGSFPQPDWLIDRKRLTEEIPPRVRAQQLWRIPEPYLAQAQDDATLLAIRAQEAAGIDIVTDGEIHRPRGRRPREARHRHHALRQAAAGAAHRRQDSSEACGRAAGSFVSS
jgi:hypothetical protein